MIKDIMASTIAMIIFKDYVIASLQLTQTYDLLVSWVKWEDLRLEECERM